MSEQSDSELISLARQGNKAAFGQLVLRYQPMAQRLAARVTGHEGLAQELVQDAMLQAYLSLGKLNDPMRFKSWLYGIVLNVCRNDWRRQRVISFSLETMIGNRIDESASLSDSSCDPQRVVEQEELHSTLREAIDTLSYKNRLATKLFYFEQLSLKEVANHLDISVNAVKGRLHKARQQLRSQLSVVQPQMHTNLLQESETMTAQTSIPARSELCCSFCGKSNKQISSLIAGPLLGNVRIYICNECIDVCNRIISGETPPLTQHEVEALINSGS